MQLLVFLNTVIGHLHLEEDSPTQLLQMDSFSSFKKVIINYTIIAYIQEYYSYQTLLDVVCIGHSREDVTNSVLIFW